MSLVKHVKITDINPVEQDNITLFKERLKQKRDELIPIVEFYETLREGWENRVGIAKRALNNVANLSKADTKNIMELISIAQLEIKRIDDSFLETSMMSEALSRKMQDLDMMALRQSSGVPGIEFNADLDSINRVFHQADALIELRQNTMKELSL
jgi:hypothetical protein